MRKVISTNAKAQTHLDVVRGKLEERNFRESKYYIRRTGKIQTTHDLVEFCFLFGRNMREQKKKITRIVIRESVHVCVYKNRIYVICLTCFAPTQLNLSMMFENEEADRWKKTDDDRGNLNNISIPFSLTTCYINL